MISLCGRETAAFRRPHGPLDVSHHRHRGRSVWGINRPPFCQEQPWCRSLSVRTPLDSAQPASIDINKIVRSEYGSGFYRSLAEEAMAAWQHESFKSFYHQTGWVLLRGSQSSSPPQPSLERNRLTQEEFRQRFDSVFEGCGLDGMEDITSNESVAWVEANAALEKTIQLATVAGATYRTEEVAGICFEDGKCNGVDLENGEQLRGFDGASNGPLDRSIYCSPPALTGPSWSLYQCWCLHGDRHPQCGRSVKVKSNADFSLSHTRYLFILNCCK
jgi:hypothetical protein